MCYREMVGVTPLISESLVAFRNIPATLRLVKVLTQITPAYSGLAQRMLEVFCK